MTQDWKMSFNFQKCEFLRITNKRHPIPVQYTLQNQPIKEVTCAKHLEVTIDKNVSWLEHTKQITNNLKSFLQRNISKCRTQIKSNCYRAQVKPILEYANTVWSPRGDHTVLYLLTPYENVYVCMVARLNGSQFSIHWEKIAQALIKCVYATASYTERH